MAQSARRQATLFSEHMTPAKVRWWMESIPNARWDASASSHFGTLREMLHGRSADETEALSYCFDRVVNDGARSASGLWCVCLNENAPSAGEARGRIGGDGIAALVAVIADLESALDMLPIGWRTVADLYEIQGRQAAFQTRFQSFKRNQTVRAVDREQEPLDPETRRPRSKQLVFAWLAWELGWKEQRATCRWPRYGEEVFSAPLASLPQELVAA